MKLQDYQGKITALMAEIEKTQSLYTKAKETFQAIDFGHPVDLSSIGLSLHIDGIHIPVGQPAAQTADSLSPHIQAAVNFLGCELQRLWNELHDTTAAAKQHIDSAFAQVMVTQPNPDPNAQPNLDAPAQQVPPPTPVSQTPPPPNIMPFPQMGSQPPAKPMTRTQLPPVVGQSPPSTVPVS